MKEKRRKLIVVRGTDGEITIYFRPGVFRPDIGQMRQVIGGLLFAGHCTGTDISRVSKGEVKLYFNPLVNTKDDRRYAVNAVKATLKSDSPQAVIIDQRPRPS
ncbi:hypothetical protein IJ135_02200 [Candidatus Saccharibacteria bacterium]|nr:hypothetical protein [Candidatus Saccharibacteria bacterium]